MHQDCHHDNDSYDESETIMWLEQKARSITTNIIDDKWISEWALLTQKYFKNEKRNPIRLKLIALLSQIFSKYHVIFEDELMNKIIIPNLNDVHNETDSVVRKPIVHLLFDLASACLSTSHCIAVLGIIKQILFKPFKAQPCSYGDEANQPKKHHHNHQHHHHHQQHHHNHHQQQRSSSINTSNNNNNIRFIYKIGNTDIIDSRLIISNLNKLFRTKLHSLPIEPAVNMLEIAVDYLQLIYRYPIQEPIPAEIPMIRRELFSFLVDLRCNKHGHLGIQLTHQTIKQVKYSPFIICVKKPQVATNAPVPSTNNLAEKLIAGAGSERMSLSDSFSEDDDDDDDDENGNCTEEFNEKNDHVILPTNVDHVDVIEDPTKNNACESTTSSRRSSKNHINSMDKLVLDDKQQHSKQEDLDSGISIQGSHYYPNCPPISKCVTLDNMFGGFIDCINHETDTDVLKFVLTELPSIMANKPLILTATNERINQLCLALSDLTRSSKSTGTGATLHHQPQIHHSNTSTVSAEIVKCSLNCLTSLPIYKSCLEHRTVKHMLAAFEESLKISRNQIVPSLTNCLIELQDSPEMTKFLPVVLDRLSKFSPTLNLGISILEFLSYLILFPSLYENFSGDEYKYIFAIALPYTNPFRFTDYITCLAFRTIAMWYLNCRPSLRCAFVEFVKKSLQSNVIQPFKENLVPVSPLAYNQQSQHHHASVQQQQQHYHHYYHQSANHHHHHQHPSSLTSLVTIPQTPNLTHSCPPSMSQVDQRKRSASFNTENSFKIHSNVNNLSSTTTNTPNQYQHNPNPHMCNSQSSLQLNEELIETFADLLSRYMHGQCLAIAPKNKYIESLIDRSTSQTWLHGNSLITITSDTTGYGWAEIFIRRPTGNTCWVGRLENNTQHQMGSPQSGLHQQQVYLDSLNFSNDVISLFKTMSLTNIEESEREMANEKAQNNGANATPTGPTLSSIGNLASSILSSSASNSISSSAASLTTMGANNSTSNSVHGGPLNQITQQQQQQSRVCKSSSDPIPLPKDKRFDIALSNFDHITPYETHKVGVVYVAEGQNNNRAAIFANKCGSPRYLEFLANMGTCIVLADIDPEVYFIGGLDTKGEDGRYAYFWKDNVTQVIFHVATFMPVRESDPHCNNKNRHIGNDHVCIVYNDTDETVQMSTIKGTGQLIYACIVVTPLDSSTNYVEVEVLPGLRDILRDAQHILEPKILSNLGASLYARQVAIDLNLASKIHERHSFGQSKEPYVSNWVERLRCIKRIRQRLDDTRRASSGNNTMSRNSSSTLK